MERSVQNRFLRFDPTGVGSPVGMTSSMAVGQYRKTSPREPHSTYSAVEMEPLCLYVRVEKLVGGM